MATWALLKNLTTFDFRSVTSDGTDIYFVQFGGGAEYHVFKYTVATDTVSQISNAASFSGTTPKLVSNFGGGVVGSAIQFFNGNLYAAVFTVDATDLHVYRYNGSGTAWTNVLTIASGGGEFALFSTPSHLIVAASSFSTLIFDWAKYSANGSSWLAATVSNSPAYISTGAGLSLSRISVTSGQGISPVFIDISSHNVGEPDPDAIYRWFEWSAGTFSITQSTTSSGGVWSPSTEWLRTPEVYLRDVFHWSRETSGGTIWKYAANLGDAWITPTNHLQNGDEIAPVISIGFTDQAGDNNGDFVLLSSGAWGTVETVAAGTGGITHAVKVASGAGFLFAALGAQSAIYGRSTAFPVQSTVAKFYYGLNTLTYRSDLPIPGVKPGAMAIAPGGNTAVVGANEASGQIVAYGSNPFGSWSNMSSPMATGSAVSSIKYV